MTLIVDNHDSSHTKTGEFPCVSCHTDCCKEYVIFVNAHDVYRLSTGLGMAPKKFLELYGAKDYSLGIQVEEGLIDLALKQNKGGCEFLEETKDVFRCTVNDFKPGVCKSYPFSMKNGKLIQMDNIMCPVDWDLAEFEKMMVSHLKKDESEWKFYDELVKEWNVKHGTKKSLATFLKFMLEKVELSMKS
ncbi:MAG: YkgJ family cysteine cluster protein [Candidatus Nitrosopumilus sp. bin_7KS]